jgi:hypothetical protein
MLKMDAKLSSANQQDIQCKKKEVQWQRYGLFALFGVFSAGAEREQ